MSFSYDLTFANPIAALRLEIDDTSPVPGMGVKPDGSCYQDEELQYFLTREGDEVGRAAAAVCEALAVAWSRVASTSIGQISEQHGETAKKYADRGVSLRNLYGYGPGVDANDSISVGSLDLGFQTTDAGTEEW